MKLVITKTVLTETCLLVSLLDLPNKVDFINCTNPKTFSAKVFNKTHRFCVKNIVNEVKVKSL